jgi:hypothetical protein
MAQLIIRSQIMFLNLMTEGRKGKIGLERSNFERKV